MKPYLLTALRYMIEVNTCIIELLDNDNVSSENEGLLFQELKDALQENYHLATTVEYFLIKKPHHVK